MANTEHVFAAEPTVAGSIFVAPLGTPAPADADDPSGATAVLDVAYVDLGDVGEGGFTENTDRRTTKKRNFGGKVIKVLQTEHGITYELVFVESLDAEVLKAIHGENNVDVLPAASDHGVQIVVRKNSKRLPHLTWVIDTIDSSLGADEDHPAIWRSWVPAGQITDTKPVKVVHSDTIEYGVTIEAFEKDGNNVITWMDDGQVTGS